MPNTKSAQKRARQSEKRHQQNRQVKSRLKTLESNYLDLVKEGKTVEAAAALRVVNSALDKAAKARVIHKGKGNRKKSRLALKSVKAK